MWKGRKGYEGTEGNSTYIELETEEIQLKPRMFMFVKSVKYYMPSFGEI